MLAEAVRAERCMPRLSLVEVVRTEVVSAERRSIEVARCRNACIPGLGILLPAYNSPTPPNHCRGRNPMRPRRS